MRKWLPLLTVVLGTFMLLIDVTIVNVALPDMAVDLKTSFEGLQWVVDAYALVLAALVLGIGSIADRIGHRKAYIIGLGLFAVSSILCGISPGAEVLIAFRAIQGLGAAAMFATTFALLNSSYHGRDRGVAYGVWGAVAGASTSIGPVLGGVLTEGVSWRWIFFVNVPISALAISLCVWVLTDVHAPGKRRIDLPGIVAFSAAAGVATYAFIRANERGWANAITYALLAAAVLLLVAFLVIEAKSREPMIELALLRRASFSGVLVGAFLLSFAAFAYFTYTSVWMQSVLGMGAIATGLATLPMSVAAFIVSALLGRFLHGNKIGLIIAGGLMLIGLGSLLHLLLLNSPDNWVMLIPGFVVAGIGVGLATATTGSAAMAAVPLQRGGMAAGAVNTTRQLGFAFGIALLGTVFSVRAASSFRGEGADNPSELATALAGGQAPHLLATAPGASRGAMSDALHHAALSGLHGVFLVSTIAGFLGAILVFFTVRPQPARAPATEPDTSAVAAAA